MDAPPLTEDELNQIYNWVDSIPLSRPKKNITRDFSDGCMMAEIVAHYHPKFVELHNYSLAHSIQQKLYNWNTLNQKVFKRLGFQISKNDIDHIVNNTPDAIERILKVVQIKIDKYKETAGKSASSAPLGVPPRNDNSGLQQQGGGIPYAAQQASAAHNVVQNKHAGAQPHQYQLPDYINPKDVKALLLEKDTTINELRETIEILELKIKKMEQLIKLKDSKIQTLINKLAQAGQSHLQ